MNEEVREEKELLPENSGGEGAPASPEEAPEDKEREERMDRYVRDFDRRYPQVGAERLLQDENFVLFCGTRLGKEPLTDLFQAYVELFHALTQMGAARQESKTDRGTGSGGSGGGPALSPDQQKALDEWNKAFPRLKMSAKEFLARV